MTPLAKQILQTAEVLPEEDQKQILVFIEFLQAKRQKIVSSGSKDARSFFEVAQAAIGAGEGPGDLSTNLSYMQGYGQ
ncbi:MAG: DUF2281 domain-containing protein [Phormidesmis sp.]